jgi:DNA-binding transcriptional regulator YiaG
MQMPSPLVSGTPLVRRPLGPRTTTLHEERIQNPLREFSAQDLREWRTVYQLTQEELAEMLNVQPNTIARWERGNKPIGNARMLTLSLQAISFSLAVQQTIRMPVD